MDNDFWKYFVVPLGAFVCWMFKGFKGTFDDQYNDKHSNVNLCVATLVLVLLIITIGIYSNKKVSA